MVLKLALVDATAQVTNSRDILLLKQLMNHVLLLIEISFQHPQLSPQLNVLLLECVSLHFEFDGLSV